MHVVIGGPPHSKPFRSCIYGNCLQANSKAEGPEKLLPVSFLRVLALESIFLISCHMIMTLSRRWQTSAPASPVTTIKAHCVHILFRDVMVSASSAFFYSLVHQCSGGGGKLRLYWLLPHGTLEML